MGGLRRGWCRLLLGLVTAALVLTGCSGAAVVQVAAPQGEPASVLTINVEMTDSGFEPKSIRIPTGQTVQLVLRNRGTTEHHFKVQGLAPGEILWLTREAGAREEGVSEEEHAAHHTSTGFVDWRGISPSGIKPSGKEVHGYAMQGAMDAVIFTAPKAGTYKFGCVLHPQLVGTLTVK